MCPQKGCCCIITKKWSRRALACCCPITSGLSILAASITLIALIEANVIFSPFIQTVSNLAEAVTIDIKRVQGSSGDCQSLLKPQTDYPMTWKPISSFKFEGMTEGCDCGSYQKNKPCEPSCIQVNQVKNQSLILWGTQQVPYTLCKLVFGESGKTGPNFLNNHILQSGKCKNDNLGYNVICNIGAPIQFQYCMPRLNYCPIMEIISSEKGDLNIGESDYFNFQGTPNSDNYTRVQPSTQFYFSSKYFTHSPISEFRLVWGEDVCQDNQQIKSVEEKYGLLKKKSAGCRGKFNNSRFIKLDQMKASEFLTLNLPEVSELPGYKPDPSEKITLAYSPYIFWRMDCRGSELDSIIMIVYNIVEILDLFIIVIISSAVSISLTIIGAIGLVMEFSKKISDDPYKVKCNCGYGIYCRILLCCKRCWKKQTLDVRFLDYFQLIDPMVFITMLLHALSVIIQFLTSLLPLAKMRAVSSIIEILSEQKCSDDSTNKIIDDLLENLKNNGLNMTISVVFISLVNTIIVSYGYSFMWYGIIQRRRAGFQIIQNLKLPENSFCSVNEDEIENQFKNLMESNGNRIQPAKQNFNMTEMSMIMNSNEPAQTQLNVVNVSPSSNQRNGQQNLSQFSLSQTKSLNTQQIHIHSLNE